MVMKPTFLKKWVFDHHVIFSVPSTIFSHVFTLDNL